MRRISTMLLVFFVFGASALQAEFSYTRTTRVTGGSLLNMSRFIPGAGSIREPQTHTVAVKGGKVAEQIVGYVPKDTIDKSVTKVLA